MTEAQLEAVEHADLDMRAAIDVLNSSPTDKEWDIRAAEIAKALQDTLDELNKAFPHLNFYDENWMRSRKKDGWQRKLHTGDEVTWNDPDDGLCTRTVTIVSIVWTGEIATITYEGGELQAFIHELSQVIK